MEQPRICKVVNNNMVSVVEDGRETLFRGPGIGYGKRPGDVCDLAKAEQRFVLADSSSMSRMVELVREAPDDLVDVCIDVVDRIKAASAEMIRDSLYLTLLDHVANLLERLEAGISFDNSLLWDLKTIYPREYELAVGATRELQRRLDAPIDDSEASFITLHIVNAEMTSGGMDRTFRFTTYVEDIRDIVASNLNISIDLDEYHTHRFMVHLRYLFGRIEGRVTDDIPLDGSLADEIGKSHPNELRVVDKISSYIEMTQNYRLNDDERLYLLVHIVQIFKSSPPAEGSRTKA